MTASLRALTAVSPSHQKARAAPVRPQRQPLHENDLGPAVPRVATSLASLPAQPQPPCSPRVQARRVGASATPARPQRMCAECATEEEDKQSGQGTPVRPRLEVGPADDAYEREADAIAAETLSRPALPSMEQAGAISTSSETLSLSAQPMRIRRRCAACGAEEENARARKRDKGGETAAAGPPRLAASPSTLTSGGRALPSATRDFFESRMGRDLSHVRVHEGSEAGRLNAGIDAHAFTYGSHIWLGQGEKADTGFTMAHELAHVLQQTQPGETRARRRGLEASTSPRTIQRKGPLSGSDLKAFWLPDSPGAKASPKTQHENIHNAAIDALGKANGNLIQEAPVPNATRKGPTFSSHGWADLFSAKTTIGLRRIAATATAGQSNLENFTISDVERGFRGSKKGGKTFDHNDERRPKLDSAGRMLGIGEAPQQVQIGEVKPGHNPSYAAAGEAQVGYYADGIKGVVDAVRQERTDAKLKPNWNFRTQNFFLGSATIPDGWNATRDSDKNLHDLVLHYKKKNYRPKQAKGSVPRKKLVGRWVLAKHHTLKGVWVYFMRPNEASLKTFFNRKGDNIVIKKIGKILQKEVLGPLMATPEKKKKRRRALGSPVMTKPGARAIRRKGGSISKAPTTVDPFDFAAWDAARVGKRGAPGDSFKGQFEKAFPDQDQESLIFNAGAVESIQELQKNNGGLGISLPPGARDIKNHGREISRFQFWAGPKASVIGRLRDMFGSLSVTVWKAAAAAKEKIGALLAKFEFKGSGKASGFKRIAMKVGANLLKLIGTMVVTNTVEALARCITHGIANKLESLVEEEVELLEEKIEQIETFIKETEKKIVEQVESIFTGILTQYEAEIEKFKDLAEDAAFILELASLIQKAIRAGRLLACVTSTASGPPGAAIVCGAALVDEVLSWVDMSPVDLLAERIMSSCEAQKYLSTFIAASDFVRNIPILLGEPIRAGIQGLLPADFKDVICSKAEFESGIKKFKKNDIDCKPGSGGEGGNGSGSGGKTANGGAQTGASPAGGAGNSAQGGDKQAEQGKVGSGSEQKNSKGGGSGSTSKEGSSEQTVKVAPTEAVGPDEKGTGNQDYRILILEGLPKPAEMAKVDPKVGLSKEVSVRVRRVSTNKSEVIKENITFYSISGPNAEGVYSYKWDWSRRFKIPSLGLLIPLGGVDGSYEGVPE
jgi:hypothetical protein